MGFDAYVYFQFPTVWVNKNESVGKSKNSSKYRFDALNQLLYLVSNFYFPTDPYTYKSFIILSFLVSIVVSYTTSYIYGDVSTKFTTVTIVILNFISDFQLSA